MKTSIRYTFFIILFAAFLFSCKDEEPDGKEEEPYKYLEEVNVNVVLPEGSSADLSNAVLFSLGASSDVDGSKTGKLPFNPDSFEPAYLLDDDNNVLMAGFISDHNSEISIETTVEFMLYYAFDYYLLSAPNARKVFLENVRNMPQFQEIVSVMEKLFAEDPLMYSKGSYLTKYDLKKIQASVVSEPLQLKRLLIEGKETRSGITVSKIDSVNVKLQNAFPRRTKVFAYKKMYYDRDRSPHEVPQYWNNPIVTFDFEPGKKMNIETLEVGSKLAQVNAQSASIDNVSESDPVHLPVNTSTEFAVVYQLVVIGSGDLNIIDRNLSSGEQEAYENLNVETYALDYLLPTILDIGGNKNLLPPFGSEKETALLNAVLPALEANPDVYNAIKKNDFKAASETLLPELFGDIRLSNNLRSLLTNVYNVLSDNGTMPNTFVQNHELTETGYERIKKVMEAVYKNMNFDSKVNIELLRTDAKSIESWTVNSIDAVVEMSPKEADVCLGESLSLKTSLVTFFDPEVEEVEFHWKTSNNYGGRVQDINNDPNNFGASIITKTNEVSYISAALESELSSGDNIETVSVVVYYKNKETGELSKAGQDFMKVNNKKGCVSFFVEFSKEVALNSFTSLLCGGEMEYSVGHPTFVAKFEAVEGARSYKGRIQRRDGTFGDEFSLTQLDEEGDLLVYRLGVGSIVVFMTCDGADAIYEQQQRLNKLDEVGHVGIEITPVF